MIANWVKETTTTTGTGIITLAGAAAGHIPFSAVVADGRPVLYMIKSGNNREYGIGIFTASGTTLARTKILATLVAGTYDNSSPIAITLAGTSDVMIASSARDITPALMTANPNGNYLYDAYRPQAVTNVTCVADRLFAMQYIVVGSAPISGLGLGRVITAATVGSVARIGIYAEGIDGNPGIPLYETNGTVSVSTTGYYRTVSLAANVELQGGKYFIAVLTDSNAVLEGFNNNNYTVPYFGAVPDNGIIPSLVYNITAGWSSMPDLTGVTPSAIGNYGELPKLFALTV